MKALLFFALLGTAMLPNIEPSKARDLPWCALYNSGKIKCGFATIEQCQATLPGGDGWCTQHPTYDTGPARRRW